MKPFWKSREVWVLGVMMLNQVLAWTGSPVIEPTPEFYTAGIALVSAIRIFLTETKLSFK